MKKEFNLTTSNAFCQKQLLQQYQLKFTKLQKNNRAGE